MRAAASLCLLPFCPKSSAHATLFASGAGSSCLFYRGWPQRGGCSSLRTMRAAPTWIRRAPTAPPERALFEMLGLVIFMGAAVFQRQDSHSSGPNLSSKERSTGSTPGLGHCFSYQAELLLRRKALLSLAARCSSCCAAIWFGIILFLCWALLLKIFSCVSGCVCVLGGWIFIL